MNERIRELAEQAQQYAEWTTPQGLEWFDAFKEKFAELIVRECVKQSKEIQSQTIANGTEDYCAGREMGIEVVINEITRHFGIQA